MNSVAVVTDTTAYLPEEEVRRLSIHLVSLYVVFGSERTEQEWNITDYHAFFEELRRADALPTTSQPSVGDFIAVYEPLLEAGQDIVSMHLSGTLSGTCGAARQAAEQLERDGKGGERIRIVDTETAAGGQGICVLAAATAAAGGADAEAVEKRAHDARAAMKMWFAVDTLEFLRRGGRIGAASAWIGSTLKVKPILTVEADIAPIERVRTSGRAFARMVDYARQRHESGADAWVVQHISALDQAEALAAECRQVFGREPLFVSEIGPVLSTHVGPGLIGVGAVPTSLFE